MFEKILSFIVKKAAAKAVEQVEIAVGSGNGDVKKALALQLITDKMPVPDPFKKIVAGMVVDVIDQSIEIAVSKLKAAV